MTWASSTLAAGDVAELEEMVRGMEAAWRARDAAAYADQFTADADHINAYGMWWRGRQEIAEGIGFALNQIYPTNPIRAEAVEVSGLGPDLALVRYRWSLAPYVDPDGTRQDRPEGRITEVLVRLSEGWRIKTFQSTFINWSVPQSR